MQPQVKLTRVMADPYGELLPHAYVVHKQSQMCRCGHLHSWTQMMTETHIKSTMVKGKYSTIHRRVDEIKYNLPIARVIETPLEKVMFCHECYSTASLAHLPSPPTPEPKLQPSWVGSKTPQTLHDKPKSAKPKAQPVTIDDLLI